MRREEVTLAVFKQFLELIGYKLEQINDKELLQGRIGIQPYFNIVNNLGDKTDYVVNEELLELDVQGTTISFFFNECWVETMDSDAISLMSKEENSGIFINFTKQ